MTEAGDLGRGRECYARRAWQASFEALTRADRAVPLGAGDLELLAGAAYMLGRDDQYVDGLTRAHRIHRERGDIPAAARCAFWIGHNLLFRGEGPQAGGWFARARRLLEGGRQDCVERGYLLIPVWLEQMSAGDWAGGAGTAAEAAAIGERFGDADLVWLARDEQGRALLKQGRREEGLRLVDEALVVATAGELSSIVTGIVYCNTIAFCHDAFELRHARAWTEALTRWCESQPEMVAHNGLCMVHRAEVMQLQGAWADALEEARRAAAWFTEGVLNQLACGKALYRQGELHRQRGELSSAERAYREAGLRGCEPQPGLALLRLAQGRRDAAAAGIRRAVSETTEPLRRAALLPAYVEIMLEVGDVEAARTAARQLEEVARRQGNDVVHAMCAHATGAVLLADGDAGTALAALRRAARAWQEIGAPYDGARARVLVALACRLLGDEDAAGLELQAARATFERLGARPEIARVDSLAGDGAGGEHGLTARELEVLRLLSTGRSNREIAETLTISEHTVARHVQNIFAKLGVTSRTAAGAFAFERGLV